MGEIKELYPDSQHQLLVPAQHGPVWDSRSTGAGVSGLGPSSVCGIGGQHPSVDTPRRGTQKPAGGVQLWLSIHTTGRGPVDTNHCLIGYPSSVAPGTAIELSRKGFSVCTQLCMSVYP